MYAPIFRGWFRRQRHILLRMDLSSDCSLKCIHCYRSSCPPHFNSIQAEQIHLLEREVFPFIHRLDLSTVGEPLTSPLLPEVISAAKKAGVACVGMTTNGMLLTEEIARDLLERGLDWLAVSLDAAAGGTYERIRCGGNWRVLMENLSGLKRVRARSSKRMSLALNYAIMEQNADEAVAFPSLAHTLGADSVSFLPLTIEREEMKSWSLFYTPAKWNRLMRDLRLEVARIGLPAALPDNLPESEDSSSPEGKADSMESDRKVCPAAEESWVFMTPDGNCFPCPNVLGEGSYGNAFESTFKKIWDSPRNQEFRRRAKVSGEVQGCDHCKNFACGKTPIREVAYLSKRLLLERSEANSQRKVI